MLFLPSEVHGSVNTTTRTSKKGTGKPCMSYLRAHTPPTTITITTTTTTTTTTTSFPSPMITKMWKLAPHPDHCARKTIC
ncbi:hypothetical protein E2C01_004518 [Portunus trituberculatus]|uniref:Uncharacterized protein n=1 Tax=Portunus trituberculatus TaxID=210409 RepID=A0A5B7CT74_PORTR|nr:hypothetical protein [Portunus trituberculatus]